MELKQAAEVLSKRVELLQFDMAKTIAVIEKEYSVAVTRCDIRTWTVPDDGTLLRGGQAGVDINVFVVPSQWVDTSFFLDDGELDLDSKFEEPEEDPPISIIRRRLTESLAMMVLSFTHETGVGISGVKCRSEEWRNILGDPLGERKCFVKVNPVLSDTTDTLSTPDDKQFDEFDEYEDDEDDECQEIQLGLVDDDEDDS